MSMNLYQVKKLRKIVRAKKPATKNNKIFVCIMKKTSVNYKMVITLIPCLLYSFAPFQNLEKIFMYIFGFRPFQSSTTAQKERCNRPNYRSAWARFGYLSGTSSSAPFLFISVNQSDLFSFVVCRQWTEHACALSCIVEVME